MCSRERKIKKKRRSTTHTLTLYYKHSLLHTRTHFLSTTLPLPHYCTHSLLHTHTHFPSLSCRTSSPLFPLSVGRRKASEVQRLDSLPSRARNFRSLVGWLGLVLSPGKPPSDQIWPCLVFPFPAGRLAGWRDSGSGWLVGGSGWLAG